MNNEHIDELIFNAQKISSKATYIIDFLLDKETLGFEEIRHIYGKLEIIAGAAITSHVFIETSIADYCIKCGGNKFLIDWDEGIVECQNLACQCKRSLKPLRKLSQPFPSN